MTISGVTSAFGISRTLQTAGKGWLAAGGVKRYRRLAPALSGRWAFISECPLRDPERTLLAHDANCVVGQLRRVADGGGRKADPIGAF